MDLKDELDRPIYWSRLGLDRPLSVRRPVGVEAMGANRTSLR